MVVSELRADSGVAAVVLDKVWGEERPGRWHGRPLPPDPRPYIIVHRLAPPMRLKRAPVMLERFAVSGFAKTPHLGHQLYGLWSLVLHSQGPRVSGAGVAIYLSTEEIGGQNLTDPVTGWPQETAIYNVFAATQVVA